MKRFIELRNHKGELDGVVQVSLDGFANIAVGWLKELILDAGGTYEEVEDVD